MTQRNAAAFMRHMMRLKQIQAFRAMRKAASGGADEKLQMTETRIYVGLNDAETRTQEHDTEHYLSGMKEICKKHHVAFTVDLEQGGYYHEDGEYTEENSLVLILIDADAALVRRIAKELCAAFHQESVPVTEDRVSGSFISAEAEAAEE